MATAIRSDNSVVFLEHKLLYLGAAAPVPEAHYAVPAGVARIVRPGRDCTLVATLAMVGRAVQAAERLAREGIDGEVIDPRTLRPFDFETVAGSVRRIDRPVVVHEAPVFGGFGGEIAARIMSDAFDWLDAPVTRVGAPETPMPHNDRLERAWMPDAQAIAEAVRSVCYRSWAMRRQVIVPPGRENIYDAFHYAPDLLVGDVLHISGQVGRDASLRVVEGALAQYEQAFENVGRVLAAAGETFEDVVELDT